MWHITTTRNSFEPQDWIFVKGYGFLTFAKNISKSIGKNISENLSNKYSPKLLDHNKKSPTDAHKHKTTFKKVIQKQ